jgi:hypothetical protein
MHRIFLGVPTSGSVRNGALTAFTSASRNHKFMARTCDAGYIPHNFNCLWADAYNQRDELKLDRFAMHHHDIRAEIFFLDSLMDEMERVDADILSVVMAICDDRGLSSTGIHVPGTWDTRRLTMSEAHDLPPTFSIADTPWPGAWLAINTGLMLCRFDKSWVDEFPGFQLRTRLIDADGKKFAVQWPEDFELSRWANERGLSVFATRKVAAWHRGEKEYGNSLPWGEWTTDQDALELSEEVKNADNSLARGGHNLCHR